MINFLDDYHPISTKNCIYKAHDKLNNRDYIGKTESELRIRIGRHFCDAKDGTSKFYRIIRKYGQDNIEWSILYAMDNQGPLNDSEKAHLLALETRFINLYKGKWPGKEINLHDNTKYMRPKKQPKSIEQNRSYKITEAIAQQIVDMLRAGESYKTIEQTLDVSHVIVTEIAKGRTWKHLRYDKSQRGKKTKPIFDFVPVANICAGQSVVEQIKILIANKFKRRHIIHELKVDGKLVDAIKYRRRYFDVRPELNRHIYG